MGEPLGGGEKGRQQTVNRDEAISCLLKVLQEWYARHTPGQHRANVISAGIIVLHHMERNFPISHTDYITEGGQVRRISAVPRILREEFGETRRWPAESGRTSRGTRSCAEDLVGSIQSSPAARWLESCGVQERLTVLRTLKRWMAGRAQEYLNARRLPVEIDLSKPPPDIVGGLLAAGERIGKAGAVAHHLVGAKLSLRYPGRTVENRPHTAADQQGRYAGDYEINDTVFHVTVAPMPRLFEQRVPDNLRAGRRVKVLVPKNRVAAARQLADQAGVAARVDIAALEDFIGPNVEEMAEFSIAALRRYFRELLNTYNRRVEEVEADRSFLLDVPENLKE
jgi:hypothetical protein